MIGKTIGIELQSLAFRWVGLTRPSLYCLGSWPTEHGSQVFRNFHMLQVVIQEKPIRFASSCCKNKTSPKWKLYHRTFWTKSCYRYCRDPWRVLLCNFDLTPVWSLQRQNQFIWECRSLSYCYCLTSKSASFLSLLIWFIGGSQKDCQSWRKMSRLLQHLCLFFESLFRFC